MDQERPNIFTQSVANILPGDNIKITISYVEMLKYEEGYPIAGAFMAATGFMTGKWMADRIIPTGPGEEA